MSNGMTKTLSKGKAKELNGLVEQLMQLGAPDYDTVEACLDQHRNMYGVLERIRRLEPKLRTTNDRPRMENVENFTKWATDKGCTLKNVRIVEQAEYGGLGLEATGTISDTFIEVPRSLFFYIDNSARFKKLLELMPAARMRDQGNVMLALALIMERFRKDSFWEPYFDVFPVRYTTPLYYTPDDARELINTEAFFPALKLCKTIARQYGFIRKFILDNVDDLRNNFTYDVFRWAVSTVMTRQNKVPVNLSGVEGLDFTLALIPYWDMGNHAYPTTPEDRPDKARLVAATVYNAEHERLECFLDGTDPAPQGGPGVPIFIVYGRRTDAEFLVHNGFVIARNPHTSLNRLFKLNPEDPLHKERAHLLKLLGIPTEGTFTFGYATLSHVSPELIAIARVSSMNEHDLEHYTTMEVPRRNELIDKTTAHRPDLMNRTNLWLAKSMRTRLQGYPTTIEQDETLLETQNRQMHPIRRLLIEYRLEEKRMLQSYVTLACDELKRLMAEIKLGTKQSQQFVEK